MISIDYIYDFVAEGGKLTTGTAGRVIGKRLTARARKFINQRDFVVFVIDTHDPKDPFRPKNHLLLPYNMAGTGGQELYGSLKSLYQDYE